MNMSFTVKVYETGFSDDEPKKAYAKREDRREKKENKMRKKYHEARKRCRRKAIQEIDVT